MAIPVTRTEFKEYCLRKLGKPLIKINITDAQAEDRIDEALYMYRDFHYDGTQRKYYKHVITQSDITNRYITMPQEITGVINIFNVNTSSVTTSNMFSARYQFVLNHIQDFTNYDLTNYYMQKEYLSFMEEILSGRQPIRFNRHENKLYIDTDWNILKVGNYIIAEVYEALDPNTYTDIWGDRWLQNYATAKMKYQWGDNLSKFDGVQLVGGVQFNGIQIRDSADAEIKDLEDQLQNNYNISSMDMIG